MQKQGKKLGAHTLNFDELRNKIIANAQLTAEKPSFSVSSYSYLYEYFALVKKYINWTFESFLFSYCSFHYYCI